jgi:sugar/nucleoside kinase (ribokinase family)
LITKEGIRDYPAVIMDEPVIDTNGAGDALAVGFLHSFFLDGISLEEAVFKGQILARSICSREAPKNQLMTHHRWDKRYRKLKLD